MNASNFDSLVAGDDKYVEITPKTNTTPLDYITYLVSCMVPAGSTTNNLSNDTVFHNVDDNVEERNLKQTHTRTGNIGVMTTQDMIKQEREVAEFHFLSIFTRKIIGAICLGVYL